jgi:hypothetical protein
MPEIPEIFITLDGYIDALFAPEDPVRDFNAMIAADPRLESIVLQQVGVKGHDGLALSRVE